MNDSGCTLSDAVANIVKELRQSVDTFNDASSRLLSVVDSDWETASAAVSYVKMLQTMMTGSYTWSYVLAMWRNLVLA